MPRVYVVATPIGNLNDLTPRVREALSEADLIAAEDTRVTRKLTEHFGIHKQMISCHRHNEEERSDTIVSRMLEEDLTVALTCDAGTPGISDPGYQLVAACWDVGIPVVPIPGPSAVATALSVSGFDTREFAFYGFLPRESKAIRASLERIRGTGIPIAVLYESPHRVVRLLEEIAGAWPGTRVCVCCDLTKKYEQIRRGPVREILEIMKQAENTEKGEYCIVAEVPDPPEERTETAGDPAVFLLTRLLEGADEQDAVREATEHGFARNAVYRARLRIRERFEMIKEETT